MVSKYGSSLLTMVRGTWWKMLDIDIMVSISMDNWCQWVHNGNRNDKFSSRNAIIIPKCW
jgi:hypothetical protein